MRSDTSRSWRGWLYAVLVAALFSTAFWYVDQYSRWRGPSFYFAERTTKHTATSTQFRQEFATEEAPLIFQESIDVDESREWSSYRSHPSSSLVGNIEPEARAQLLAPQIPEGFKIAEAAEIAEQRAAIEGALLQKESSMRVVSSIVERSEPPKYISTPSVPAMKSTNLNGWPLPESLISEVEQLNAHAVAEESSAIAEWTQAIRGLMEELASIPSMNDPRSLEIVGQVKELSAQVLEANQRTVQLESEIGKTQYRVAYSCMRRAMVWQSIWNCMQQPGEDSNTKYVSTAKPTRVSFGELKRDIVELRRMIEGTGDTPGWSNYLLVDSLEQLSDSSEVDAEKAMKIARMFLSRVTWQRVSDSQRSLIAQASVQRIAKSLHPLAYGPIDYRQLALDLEAIEGTPTHRCRTAVAQQVQALRFANSPQQLALADQINTFYRNANLRIAISQELLQRAIPKEKVVEKPVHSKILGADTRGASQVNTKLKVDLIPDKQAWNIALRLQGDVMSNTRSSKGPATFYNDSTAIIDTARHVRVDVQGLKISGETANVASHDRLRGFNTDFDSLPLLGDVLRYVVRQQFDSERGLAQRIMRRTIADQADTEFDRTLQSKVTEAEKQLNGKIMRPLEKMELNPLVVDLETTEKRLIARYRIAGAGQMAAHTPRPLAPSDSHMSIQIHESAINNAIDKIGLPGRHWTLPELGRQLSDLLEQPAWEMSPDVPTDLTIRFADSRPLTVEFQQGKMEITLRIEELHQPEKLHLNNFVIRTSYEPVANGLSAEMVHVGPISVDATRDRLQLRTVFARVFAARQVIPLIGDSLIKDERAAGLAVSQAKIHDGWLALAVSDQNSPHIANVPSKPTTNVQR